MQIIDVPLNEVYPQLPKVGDTPILRAYLHKVGCRVEESHVYPAMLICPGGGYAILSEREAEPTALEFFTRGFNCFVLHYTCKPNGYHPCQLMQAAAAVHRIRTDPEWNNSGKVSVIGFSAGGHLAGHIATRWHEPFLSQMFGCDPETLRINALILSYAVTVFGAESHRGSFENLVGPEGTEEDCAKLDLRNFIDPAFTPPTFLWHTEVDDAVPMEDALIMAAALKKAGVPLELHVFPGGDHAVSLCNRVTGGRPLTRDPYLRRWLDMVMAWETHLMPGEFD